MQEIWTWVNGFEGIYEISNYGKIRTYMRSGKSGATPRITSRSKKTFTEATGHKKVKLGIGKGKSYHVGRLVYESFVGSIPDKMVVDHIDRNPSNNWVSNLRLATQNQNAYNRKVNLGNKAGFKGVALKATTGRYSASIGFKGTKIHIGYYTTPEEAAYAYDSKAKELFGIYAATNFLDT